SWLFDTSSDPRGIDCERVRTVENASRTVSQRITPSHTLRNSPRLAADVANACKRVGAPPPAGVCGRPRTQYHIEFDERDATLSELIAIARWSTQGSSFLATLG